MLLIGVADHHSVLEAFYNFTVELNPKRVKERGDKYRQQLQQRSPECAHNSPQYPFSEVPLAYYMDYYPPPPRSYPATTNNNKKITILYTNQHLKNSSRQTKLNKKTWTFVRRTGADFASFVRCSTRDCSFIKLKKKE